MKTNPTTNMTKATRMMTRNSLRIGSIAIVALAAAAIAGCKGTADTAQPTATPVRTATAVTGPAAPPIRTNGLLLNKDEIRLSFKVGGVIRVLDVREGGRNAPIIATTRPIENMVRGGLCNGFGRDAVGGGIGRVTYFLMPP